ncbi:kinase-like domain-containing protein [Gymnopilus junonius]|uniref:Kinase-like domain-containing protein n=1 Tax=Gymnopilus junonius TaxID=109634 RepID=A0A9P5NVC2_GYMJU|nr:kinase-like domain-containing protein [Gymnopilus junonius]
MSHSLLHPNTTFSQNTLEPLCKASPFSESNYAHSQRSISWRPFSPDTRRMENLSERSRRRISSREACHFSSSKSIPLFETEQWLPLKAGSSSDDHLGTVQHVDVPNNQLHLHLGPSSESDLPQLHYNTEACVYSSLFPADHQLNADFAEVYQLEDELGSGGYGFVMTAYHRVHGHEVAVKFIVKDKVPEHAWMYDLVAGRLPAEIVLLRGIRHANIVKCLGVFEDNFYFYLVQELHGSPWHKHHKLESRSDRSQSMPRPMSSLSTPALSPSSSETSLPTFEPSTPPHAFATLQPHVTVAHSEPTPSSPGSIPMFADSHLSGSKECKRPPYTRRPSHDLFECIEQSEHKKLTEDQARYVFAQVIDAVRYLHRCGIIHRDIKDENLVIDKSLTVKLIDFGSAIAIDPAQPAPYFQMFYGTAAYASSEILLKKNYQAAPAEIWTLGILLSYLLAGVSPFPTARDAVDGRIFLSEKVVGKISDSAMDLMRMCLDPNPDTRATISQIEDHAWLKHSSSS